MQRITTGSYQNLLVAPEQFFPEVGHIPRLARRAATQGSEIRQVHWFLLFVMKHTSLSLLEKLRWAKYRGHFYMNLHSDGGSYNSLIQRASMSQIYNWLCSLVLPSISSNMSSMPDGVGEIGFHVFEKMCKCRASEEAFSPDNYSRLLRDRVQKQVRRHHTQTTQDFEDSENFCIFTEAVRIKCPHQRLEWLMILRVICINWYHLIALSRHQYSCVYNA